MSFGHRPQFAECCCFSLSILSPTTTKMGLKWAYESFFPFAQKIALANTHLSFPYTPKEKKQLKDDSLSIRRVCVGGGRISETLLDISHKGWKKMGFWGMLLKWSRKTKIELSSPYPPFATYLRSVKQGRDFFKKENCSNDKFHIAGT